jgi:hypothetical protein
MVPSKKPKPQPAQPKPGKVRKASEILRNARATLAHAETALNDFMGDDPARQEAGLRNFIVSARSVTFVLQTMKHTVPDAEAWYEDLRARLKLDAIAKAFVELRNQVEKEGVLPEITRSATGVHIENFSQESLRGIVPRGAREVVIGEGRSGGNYWVDNGGRRHYFKAPEGVRNFGGSRFEDAPKPFPDMSVEELSYYYLGLMEKALIEAQLKFGHLP